MSVGQGVRHYPWGMSCNGATVRGGAWRGWVSPGIKHGEVSEPGGEVAMHRLPDLARDSAGRPEGHASEKLSGLWTPLILYQPKSLGESQCQGTM